MLFQQLPEGRSLMEQPNVSRRERQPVRTNGERVDGLVGFRHRRKGLHGGGVAMNEIENAVPAGVHAGDEGRPRHRTLRWNRGAQPAEIATPAQGRHVGQDIPMALNEAGVHAVHSEHDEAMCGDRDVLAAGGQKQ